MRIDDLNRTPLPQSTEPSGPANSAGNISGANNAPIAGSDQAEVSNLAQSLAAPASERIDQLRLEVQSGAYNVSAQAVASALIDAHSIQ
jgi:anti-sigma28 factor (negative regulator of flagellin synthesis)